MSSSSKFFTSNESQKRWADYTKDHYRYAYDDLDPCVCEIPKRLSDTKPDAYTPQRVGLGPYHHLRPDLQQMTNKKRAAVKRYLKMGDVEVFIHMVENCPPWSEQKIRSCYDRYIDLDRESLVWIVIIDSIFLLDFIENYLEEQQDEHYHYDASSPTELIVQDLLMLESQIPVLLILEMCKFLRSEYSIPDGGDLAVKLYRFCWQLCPFQMADDQDSNIHTAFNDPRKHMLHFIHQLSLGRKMEDLPEPDLIMMDSNSDGGDAAKVSYVQHVRAVTQHAISQGKELTKLTAEQLVSAFEGAKSKGVQLSGKVDKIFTILENVKNSLSTEDQHPLRLLPSVSQLHDVAQITFTPLPPIFGIRGTTFDEKNNIFYLPVMKLRANSEVILRNILAYETLTSHVSSEVGDFVDFVCRIIRAEKDVKILRDAKIIEGELRDDEVVRLFDRLKKSIIASTDDHKEKKPSSSLLNSIGDKLKQHFSNDPIVKACSWIKRWTLAFLNFLKPLFPILVVLLLFFQNFCQIYECRRSRISIGSYSHPTAFGEGSSFLSLDDSTQNEVMSARKFLRYPS